MREFSKYQFRVDIYFALISATLIVAGGISPDFLRTNLGLGGLSTSLFLCFSGFLLRKKNETNEDSNSTMEGKQRNQYFTNTHHIISAIFIVVGSIVEIVEANKNKKFLQGFGYGAVGFTILSSAILLIGNKIECENSRQTEKYQRRFALLAMAFSSVAIGTTLAARYPAGVSIPSVLLLAVFSFTFALLLRLQSKTFADHISRGERQLFQELGNASIVSGSSDELSSIRTINLTSF